jgi:hypothetical protein
MIKKLNKLETQEDDERITEPLDLNFSMEMKNKETLEDVLAARNKKMVQSKEST